MAINRKPVANGMTSTSSKQCMAAPVQFEPLPWMLRFYIYGIQGFCYEIVFTSLFDFFVSGDWRLRGHSAISSFFIYGSCMFCVEHLYVYLYYQHGIKWYIRKPLYVAIAYFWEFSTGSILKYYGACPWDYSHYPYNLMGLITLEYAPGWLVLAYLQDVLADFLLRVRVLPNPIQISKEKHKGKKSANSKINGF